MKLTIRSLHPVADLSAVVGFYTDAPDYWLLAEGTCDPEARAAAFFTDTPPGCNPAASDRLGLFLDSRLSGLAEVSYDFPEAGAAYLGLMVLGPWAQGAGHGRTLLGDAMTRARARGAPGIPVSPLVMSIAMTRARARGAPAMFLGVLDANPRGRAFWLREGFADTGISRVSDHGHTIRRMVRCL